MFRFWYPWVPAILPNQKPFFITYQWKCLCPGCCPRLSALWATRAWAASAPRVDWSPIHGCVTSMPFPYSSFHLPKHRTLYSCLCQTALMLFSYWKATSVSFFFKKIFHFFVPHIEHSLLGFWVVCHIVYPLVDYKQLDTEGLINNG